MPKRLNSLYRLSRSLPARIACLMTIAMLPVGLIAVYQTQAVIEGAREQNRASLAAQLRAEATPQTKTIESALAAAQGLAVLITKLGEEDCSDILKGFVESNETYAFAGFVRASGWLTCSSTADRMDLSQRPLFKTAMARGGESVQVNPEGAVTGRNVIMVTHPVREGGEMVGYVSLSIPHAILNAALEDPDHDGALRLAALNTEGEILAASLGRTAAPDYLPRDMLLSEIVQTPGQTFRAVSGSGETRYFAVTQMVPGKVILLGSWPLSAVPDADSRLQSVIASSLPVLMWLAGVGVALFGIQRLVIRHVAQLRNAMRRFALGEREETTLDLRDPPAELEEAQRAFNRMALLIAEGEQRREQDLRDKEVLLREVHHRVKNNLQLIASIMNMQSRDLETEEAKHVVSELQRRVRGMAVLHRALYNTPTSTTVDAADLVQAVVRDTQDLVAPLGKIEIDTALEHVALYPDQAIPLSLFVAETLNTAIRQTCNSGPSDRIGVKLTSSGGDQVRLCIDSAPATPVAAGAETPRPDGMAQKMIAAFLRQLGGKMETTSDDGRYRVTVMFPRATYGA
ncbi:signal transduction histidine kinase [Mameliella sp. CS4]|uniref:sensor histidine kinase n=1 Tax=Mameliella sp. CS4 TaxID=2862329 RepID=UPI001C5FDD42|nr:histidine kinase dimerization/phosphoacceptor domain -containing protein [Mameliella sp. CS4]MBW4983581.1 signal transduction histidine kinase [Mameliella sp. CS4]